MGIIAKPLRIIDRKKTTDYISEILNTSKEKNANIMANIIIGWPNLIEEDIPEVEEYLNALNIHTKKNLQMYYLITPRKA